MGDELTLEELARRTGKPVERAFCSEECLRRFVASPERYSS